MGLFDIFRRPKSDLEKFSEESIKDLFPGGREEMLFKAKVVVEISNGRLSTPEAVEVYTRAKMRFKLAALSFNGVTQLGPKADRLFERTKEDSQGKLSIIEVAGIVYYAIFDKVDSTLESSLTIKKWLDGLFGCDSVGCDSDEIPSALGEFGFDPTNPIPVRGIASSAIYLERLRALDGRKISYKRIGSLTDVPNVYGNVDEYDIGHDGGLLCRLYVSPYNQRISSRPPRGFIRVQRD